MSRPDDLESRVSALESQVRELTERVRHSQHDAAAARVLAGGADRDVTEIRAEIRDFRGATTASFNATRQDLTDLRGRMEDGFRKIDDRFRKVDDGFRSVDDGFTEIRGRLDGAAAGQEQIVALLNTLIEQQDDDAGRAGQGAPSSGSVRPPRRAPAGGRTSGTASRRRGTTCSR